MSDSQEIEGKHEGHDDKTFTIIVNARKKTVKDDKLSFDQVVKLAFEHPLTGPNIMYTITYSNGPRENPEGNLLEGKSVKIKDGMIFNVIQTDKS
jgi:hypothetical protein